MGRIGQAAFYTRKTSALTDSVEVLIGIPSDPNTGPATMVGPTGMPPTSSSRLRTPTKASTFCDEILYGVSGQLYATLIPLRSIL